MVSPLDMMADQSAVQGHRTLSVEELCFTSSMSCFEGWLKLDPAIGPRTMTYVTKFISRTLEKTHSLKDVRCRAPPPLTYLLGSTHRT